MKDTVLLPTAYLAPVSYYARLAAYPHVHLEQWEHYLKQTYRNRCLILTEGGVQALTVPVDRHLPNHAPIRELLVSRHGNWQHLHWQALVSAYERSPYFEYYADYFKPFYETPAGSLMDFNAGLQALVCRLLDIEPDVTLTSAYEATPEADDCRLLISPKYKGADPHFRPAPYFQVFAERSSFVPNLSIADLLFNEGPEAVLTLRRSFVQ